MAHWESGIFYSNVVMGICDQMIFGEGESVFAIIRRAKQVDRTADNGWMVYLFLEEGSNELEIRKWFTSIQKAERFVEEVYEDRYKEVEE